LNNITIITLDSLRWDAAILAKTPNLNKIFKKTKTYWNKVYANGTFTLPSHIAMFQNGQFPTNELDKEVDPRYTRKSDMWRWFQIKLPWKEKTRPCKFELPEAENMIKSFEKSGYTTIGVGGVKWFSDQVMTTNLWKHNYFQKFYWYEEFQEKIPNAFENQIKFIKNSLRIQEYNKLLFFLNVSSTHNPCRGNNSLQGQINALEYIDEHILEILELLPKPNTIFLLSDHGTLFKEDKVGITGHGFYHKLIMEIPMVVFEL